MKPSLGERQFRDNRLGGTIKLGTAESDAMFFAGMPRPALAPTVLTIAK
jgi:hypothetical protein